MLSPQAGTISRNRVSLLERRVSSRCTPALVGAGLIVRFIPKALPQASSSALGIAGSTGDSPVAFVFCDRVAALRSHTRLFPVMLGRVMAHELTHLLLPEQAHSETGLMRGEWVADDLRITSSAYLGLPAHSVLLMQREVVRRAMMRPNTVVQ